MCISLLFSANRNESKTLFLKFRDILWINLKPMAMSLKYLSCHIQLLSNTPRFCDLRKSFTKSHSASKLGKAYLWHIDDYLESYL